MNSNLPSSSISDLTKRPLTVKAAEYSLSSLPLLRYRARPWVLVITSGDFTL